MRSENEIDFEEYISVTLGNVLQRKALSIEQVKRIIKSNKPLYSVVATPKSGSTYLANVLMESLHLPYIPLCYAYSSNEHDLYLPALVGASAIGAVSQLHMKGTPHNVQLLNFFNIRPIILTRNIFDSVESLARDLRKKCSLGQLGHGIHGYSFTWITRDIERLSDEQLIDFVIDFALPWYVNFYVSWQSLTRQGAVKPLFVQYETLMKQKKKVITRIIKEIGGLDIEVDASILEKNFIPKSSGISRGTGASGLGLERLSNSQINTIKRFLSYYPEIDFDSWVEYE